MKLSVVIPTYQPHDIRPMLSALSQQSVLPAEVIIVENGNPGKILEQQVRNSGSDFEIKYIHDSLAGLNRARNAGVHASLGSHIAIIDDDCKPDTNWVAGIVKAHMENPQAAVVGGRVLLEYDAEQPLWLSSEFRRSLAELDYGEQQKVLGRWQHLVGANLSFSRDVFDEVGGFEESLGLMGGDEIIRANDEAEFIHKACLRGLPGAIYEGRAVVRHQIPASRLEFDYFLRRRYGQGVSDIEYDLLHSGIEKAIRSFYNKVFHSQWHFEELKRDASLLSQTQAEELLWRGMVARVLYLMGARERLITREPIFKRIKIQVKAEETAYGRGKNLFRPAVANGQASLNELLQRALYNPDIKVSPFIRIAMLSGIIQHEFNCMLDPDQLTKALV